MTLADHNDTNSLTKSSKSSLITTVLNDSIVGNKLAVVSADIEKLNNFNASDTDIAGAIANEEVGYSISLNDNGDRLAIGSINGGWLEYIQVTGTYGLNLGRLSQDLQIHILEILFHSMVPVIG